MVSEERVPGPSSRPPHGSRWIPMGSGLDPVGAVLETIRLRHGRSRAEIANHTGLSRGAVAQRVAELIELGLLEDAELSESTGGRPARRLRFRGDAGSLLVADIGATSIDVALTDLSGQILASRQEDADVTDGPDAILGRIEELFEEMLGDPSLPGIDEAPWGIGIGVPGPVEFATGRPVSPPIMPGWDGYPVRERFVQRYDAPVWVDNDVNIMALGEWRAGAGRFHAHMVFVKIGSGIGAGVIADGYLHRGARGSAGDVGHIQVTDDRSVVCRCGNLGCLEAVAGGHALARDAELAAGQNRSPYLAAVLAGNGAVSARDVADGAARGDVLCQELVTRSGHLVGATLAGVVNFFNPSLIVIGGGVASAGDQLLAAVRETIYRRSLPLATRDLLILPSALGSVTGRIGAATMVGDELFSPSHLAATIARHASASVRPRDIASLRAASP
jgi:glucokinase-like ROK family protein